jgi:hypothetical protein
VRSEVGKVFPVKHKGTLLHPKAVLFVYYGQPELIEVNFFLKDGMGADQDLYFIG